MIEWVKGYREQSRRAGTVPKTQVAHYGLRDLAERGFIKRDSVNAMLLDSGLADFNWRMVWGEDYDTSDDELETRLSRVDGYVIFIHGWTGTYNIWEDLPDQLVAG